MNHLFDNFDKIIDFPNGIKKTRELVLQLAVQGKLTNNFSKIYDISETNELQLPNHWKWEVLPNIVKNKKHSIKRGPFGSSIRKSDFVDSGYKVYEQKHAIRNNFDIGHYYIDDQKYEELKAFDVKPGDIIISCSGTIGKVAILPPNAIPGVINQALLKLTLDQSKLLNEYFSILFPAYLMKTKMLDDIKGTAIKNIVSVKELKVLPFPLPPLEEQKQIVEKVNSMMALLDELEEKRNRREAKRIKLNNSSLDKLVNSSDTKEFKQYWNSITQNFETLYSVPENVKKLKEIILQLAVQGKLTEQWRKQNPDIESASELLKKIKTKKEKLIAEGKIKKQKELPPIKDEEQPFELPKGWEWARLESIANVGTGATPLTSNSSYYNGSVHWITSSATGQDFITSSEKMITHKALDETNCRVYKCKASDGNGIS
jgi:type I restriction enzyme S subunit